MVTINSIIRRAQLSICLRPLKMMLKIISVGEYVENLKPVCIEKLKIKLSSDLGIPLMYFWMRIQKNKVRIIHNSQVVETT